jgi:hypothetical protein
VGTVDDEPIGLVLEVGKRLEPGAPGAIDGRRPAKRACDTALDDTVVGIVAPQRIRIEIVERFLPPLEQLCHFIAGQHRFDSPYRAPLQAFTRSAFAPASHIAADSTAHAPVAPTHAVAPIHGLN